MVRGTPAIYGCRMNEKQSRTDRVRMSWYVEPDAVPFWDALADQFGVKRSTILSMLAERARTDPRLLQIAFVEPFMASIQAMAGSGVLGGIGPNGTGQTKPPESGESAPTHPLVHTSTEPREHVHQAAAAAAPVNKKRKKDPPDPALWVPFDEAWAEHRDSGASLGNKASGRNNGWRQFQRLVKASGLKPEQVKERWLRRLAARGQFAEQPQRMLNPDNGMLTDEALADQERNAKARASRESETRMKPAAHAGNPSTSLAELRAAKAAALADRAAEPDEELERKAAELSKKLGVSF